MSHVQDSIDTHGAEAVYMAAANYMAGDHDALWCVDLAEQDEAVSLARAWNIQTQAYQQMTMMDVVEDQADVAAKLATI